MLRAGVAGGVLSTVAVTGAAASANAAEPAQKTVEMPAVAAAVANASAQSTAATAQVAADYEYRSEIRAEQAQAALTAKKTAAKKAEAIAERKAEAKRKAAAAAERASRSSARTTLSGSGSVASVLSFLQAQVGKAYVMGASGPSAYDCSGLTLQAFKTAGVNLPRTSQDQSTTGTAVSVDALQPGDLIFWGGTGSAYHVGVFVGNGQYIDAANPEKGVVKQNLDDYPPTSARRVL